MRICILTDSTAQFSRVTFTGHNLVKVIQFDIPNRANPHLAALSVEDFSREYNLLSHHFDFILGIFLSESLNPIAETAALAATHYGGRAEVVVIDSQTTGAGLGMLVEMAAGAVMTGHSVFDAEHMVRSAIPHVFTLVCVPDITHLAQTGYLTSSQSRVGEMLGIMPMFMMEDGHLSPFEKVRTHRHLVESFQEFLEEFSDPKHVALMKGPQNTLRSRPLKQYVAETFPHTQYSEHTFNAPLSMLLGSQSVGLCLLEKG